MKLFLVRHGESVANRQGFHNRVHERLTKRGVGESEAAAELLSKYRFDMLFVSPLRRARQTAAIILMRHPDLRMVVDARLCERNSGEHAGRPHGVRREAANALGLTDDKYRPVGGESRSDMEERVHEFIRELLSMHSETECVLIVSHRGPLETIVRRFGGASESRLRNGCIVTVVADDSVET